MFNKKYIAVFLTNEQGSYTISKKIRFKIPKKKLSYKKTLYSIKINNPSFTQGLKILYCFDIDTGKQLLFGKSKVNNMDLKFLDSIVAQDLMKKLASDMSENNIKDKIFNLIIGGLIGASISFIVAGFMFGGFSI